LFPYARAALPAFVAQHANDAAMHAVLNDVAELSGQPRDDTAALIASLLGWIDEDKKITPLKTLQGMIWQTGYQNGAFTGHVYADVFEYLQRWKGQGLRLYVFSSGSVKAQQLLFAYSDFGNLTPLFDGYFDTTTGAKQSAAAYRKIAEAIGLAAADIVFLSDVSGELDAAREAGMHTVLLDRKGAIPTSAHTKVHYFSEIDLKELS
jgi:enolase-phosphatase E1